MSITLLVRTHHFVRYSNMPTALFNIVFKITQRMLMISNFVRYPKHFVRYTKHFINNFEQKLDNINKTLNGFYQ